MAISVIRLLCSVGDNLAFLELIPFLFFRFHQIVEADPPFSRFPLAKRGAVRYPISIPGCLIRNEGNYPLEFFAMALLFSFPSDLFA